MPWTHEEEQRLRKVITAMMAMQRASWEQGTAMQALLELNATGSFKDKLTQNVIGMAHDAVVRQDGSGRLAIVHGGDPGLLDPASCIPAILEAGRITRDPKYEAAAHKQIDYLLDKDALRTSSGTLSHRTDKLQLWVDGIYMGPPSLATVGLAWKDASLLEEAVRQIQGYRDALWSPSDKLFSHIWDEPSHSFERKAYWGVGNGWAIAGMTRVLLMLPTDSDSKSLSSARDEILGYIKEAIDGVLIHERSDHLFHDILDDPLSFVETNVGQQLAYSIFRLVYHGLLDFQYLRRAEEMRKAAHTKVDQWGLVQGVCGSPRFISSGTATEGQAFYILMEAAYHDIPYY